MELVPEKFKLLAFVPRGQEITVDIDKMTSNISVSGLKISFTDEAEHVGLIRATNGNMTNTLR